MFIELGKKFFQNFFNNPSLKIQTRLFFQNKITNYNEKILRRIKIIEFSLLFSKFRKTKSKKKKGNKEQIAPQ